MLATWEMVVLKMLTFKFLVGVTYILCWRWRENFSFVEKKADAQHVAVRQDLYSNAFNLISSFEWIFLLRETHYETTISSRKVLLDKILFHFDFVKEILFSFSWTFCVSFFFFVRKFQFMLKNMLQVLIFFVI